MRQGRVAFGISRSSAFNRTRRDDTARERTIQQRCFELQPTKKTWLRRYQDTRPIRFGPHGAQETQDPCLRDRSSRRKYVSGRSKKQRPVSKMASSKVSSQVAARLTTLQICEVSEQGASRARAPQYRSPCSSIPPASSRFPDQ